MHARRGDELRDPDREVGRRADEQRVRVRAFSGPRADHPRSGYLDGLGPVDLPGIAPCLLQTKHQQPRLPPRPRDVTRQAVIGRYFWYGSNHSSVLNPHRTSDSRQAAASHSAAHDAN